MTDKLMREREHERKKYEDIYSCQVCGEGYPRYGKANHWKEAWQTIVSLAPKSLIDVGTGWGDLPRKLYEEKVCTLSVGIDFAMPAEAVGFWGQGEEYELVLSRDPAHDISAEDKEFEWLTAFDMLEHLVPDEVEEVIKEFVRVTQRGFIFSVSYHPSIILSPSGENLHPTVRPRDWWIGTIEGATGAPIEVQGRCLICKFG